MATVTAQILVGHPDTFHAGIWPTHGLYLFENSRPYWVLAPLGLQLEEGPAGRAYTWLPTPDHVLEDGLTMIFLYAVRDAAVRALAPRSLGDDATWRDLAGATSAGERADLARACRASAARCKVVVTVLEGSSLAGRLALLEEYPVDIEVCASRFVRELEGWRGGVVRRGAL
jgi:hypothetical protein